MRLVPVQRTLHLITISSNRQYPIKVIIATNNLCIINITKRHSDLVVTCEFFQGPVSIQLLDTVIPFITTGINNINERVVLFVIHHIHCLPCFCDRIRNYDACIPCADACPGTILKRNGVHTIF